MDEGRLFVRTPSPHGFRPGVGRRLREPSSRRLVSGGCNLVTDCVRVIRLDASKLPVANFGYWPVVRVRGRAKKLTFDPAAGVSPG
jgi:hypothetical protein